MWHCHKQQTCTHISFYCAIKPSALLLQLMFIFDVFQTHLIEELRTWSSVSYHDVSKFRIYEDETTCKLFFQTKDKTNKDDVKNGRSTGDLNLKMKDGFYKPWMRIKFRNFLQKLRWMKNCYSVIFDNSWSGFEYLDFCLWWKFIQNPEKSELSS